MKHPIAFKCFVLAAILAANGCTYDNLDKLNQTTEACDENDCQNKPANAHYSSVSGTKGNCSCVYECDDGFHDNGTNASNCVPDVPVKCNQEDDCEPAPTNASFKEVFGNKGNCSCVYECNADYHPKDESVTDHNINCISCLHDEQCDAEQQYCCENSAWRCTSGKCFNLQDECYNRVQCRSGYCDVINKKCIDEPNCTDEDCCRIIDLHWSQTKESCVECLDSTHCPGITEDKPFGFYCSKEYTCVPKLDNGIACSEDFECKSGYCNPDGEVCDCNNTDNKGDACCNSLNNTNQFWSTGQNQCVEIKGIGDVCNEDRECETKKCELDAEGVMVCKEVKDCSDLDCDEAPNHAHAERVIEDNQCVCKYVCDDNFTNMNYDGSKGDELICVERCLESNCSNTLATDGMSFILGYKEDDLCQCVYKCGEHLYNLSSVDERKLCCKESGKQLSVDEKLCEESACTDATCEGVLKVPESAEYESVTKTQNGGCECNYKCGSQTLNLSDSSNLDVCCSAIPSGTPYWSSTSNQCVVKKINGDACNGHTECNSGYCNSNHVCATCNNNGCCNEIDSNKPWWSGNACYGCTTDIECDSINGKPYCSNKKCVDKKEIGDTCNSANECSSQICINSKCAERCEAHQNCMTDYYCDSKNGKCIEKKLGGESCDVPVECGSNSCISKVCRCRENEEPGYPAVACKTNMMCKGVDCVGIKETGESCVDSSECRSGVCSAEKCVCTSHEQCDDKMFCNGRGMCEDKTESGYACSNSIDEQHSNASCISSSCINYAIDDSYKDWGCACTDEERYKECGDSSRLCRSDHFCRTKAGQGCSSDLECFSGYCNSDQKCQCRCEKEVIGYENVSFSDGCYENGCKIGGVECEDDNDCLSGSCLPNNNTCSCIDSDFGEKEIGCVNGTCSSDGYCK